MKKILFLVFFNYTLFAKAYYNLLPYFGAIDYYNSIRKEGYIEGIYFSDFESPFKTEIDIEQTSILYKDTTPDLTQGDFTFLVNYYQGYNLAYKFGLHYIDSTDTQTDGGIIFIGGILYYKTLLYNYGLDVYYSNYSNFDIFQVTPKLGFNFGDYYSIFGSFYLELKADYINTENNNYFSYNLEFNNYNSNFTTTIGFWDGKRSYGVESGGFVINNLSELQTGGFKFSETYQIDKVSSIKFSYSQKKFQDLADAKSKLYLISYSYSF